MKIGVISPSKEFTRLVNKVSSDLKIPVLVRQGALQRGLHEAKKLVDEENVSVIIARGATADLLEKHIETPIIKIKVNGFDLLKAIHKANINTKNIYFIDHYQNEQKYDLELFEDIFSIKIKTMPYKDERDITTHIKEISNTHTSSIILGTAECLQQTATQKGVTAYVVDSTSEAVRDAILQAKDTAHFYKQERLRQKHLETIISYAFDGVIATDTNGEIFVYNDIAEQMLGIHPVEVIGRRLDRIHHPFLKKLFGNGKTVEQKIISLGDKRYIVNRVKIEENSKSTIVTFQEANKLVELDVQMRRQLYEKRFYAKHSFEDIHYEGEIMEKTIEVARQFSKVESSISIYGESGTGKELFAQGIHNSSPRKDGPFIAVNCAALPRDLLESELFGYEDGAFTGAKKGGKPGLFEMAHRGTIFLDEIGELPIDLQSRLLRVLQEKEVMRIGGERIIPVNVRVITATNKNLKELVKKRSFREDLYFRLNILQLKIPPLRERRDDIIRLSHAFLIKRNIDISILDESIIKELKEYSWPGNVRELENVLERISLIQHLDIKEGKQFIFDSIEEDNHYNREKVEVNVGPMRKMEQEIIQILLKKHGGNKKDIADILDVSRTTIWNKIKGIENDEITMG